MSSGDEIEAGRVTTGESTTDLLGALPSELDVGFNGVVILRVAPQPGELKPNNSFDGIHGVGNNGSVGGAATPGGTGVVGFGSPNQGTGVSGLGGGLNGSGGSGVHGVGGSQSSPSFDPSGRPGVGVFAQGGRMGDDDNDQRFLHGAGVIGLAGKRPMPPTSDTGSVGVYGHGAEAEVRVVNIDGVDVTVGPIAPGAGVLGRGGVPIPFREQPVAAGVIGLAGDTAIPTISESGNTGVYGGGPIGVKGVGMSVGVSGRADSGPGVSGNGFPGVLGIAADPAARGGQFESTRSAQLQLVPHRFDQRIPNLAPVTPTALPAGSEPKLPKDGRGGDLLVVEMKSENNQQACTLWFCVQGAASGPARWAQVLVGSACDGKS